MNSSTLQEKFQFFKNLAPQELEQFIQYCEDLRADAGTLLWNEGDKDNYAAFILEGKLGIKKKTQFDGKHVIVGVYAPGSVAGELCLLTDNPRAVTAEVIEPARILILHSRRFEQMIEEHPKLGLGLLKHIFITTSRRLTKTYERIATIF